MSRPLEAAPSGSLFQDLYRDFVKRVPLQERAATATSVAIRVEKGLSGADALMPFLYYDPAFAVVSSSALHMAGQTRSGLLFAADGRIHWVSPEGGQRREC
jgi:hypothetical protein